MKSIRNKKGVSPVVATVLLIAIVIILAIIIFLWARGFVAERAQKFGRAVEFSCEDVNFEIGIYNDQGTFYLDVINRGDVPLYGFNIKEIGQGEVIVRDTLTETVAIGESTSIELPGVSQNQELIVVPVILGETNAGRVAHTCSDNFGFATFVP